MPYPDEYSNLYSFAGGATRNGVGGQYRLSGEQEDIIEVDSDCSPPSIHYLAGVGVPELEPVFPNGATSSPPDHVTRTESISPPPLQFLPPPPSPAEYPPSADSRSNPQSYPPSPRIWKIAPDSPLSPPLDPQPSGVSFQTAPAQVHGVLSEGYSYPPPPPPRRNNSYSSLAPGLPPGHYRPLASYPEALSYLLNLGEFPRPEGNRSFGVLHNDYTPFLPGNSHAEDCKSKLDQPLHLTRNNNRTGDGNDNTSGEDPIPVRVSRIKARVAELIGDIEDTNGPQTSREIHPPPITVAATFTDSAYGSASVTTGRGIPKNDDVVAGQLSQESTEQVADDLATEYSDNSSATSSKKQAYISELAHDLYNKVGSLDVERISEAELSTTLPPLLQAFALKVGYQAPTQMHRDIMAFVHKYRREITVAFIALCASKVDDEEEETKDQSAPMSLQERMDLGEKSEETEQPRLAEDSEGTELQHEDVEEEEVDVKMETWLAPYREFAPSTEAYSWLLIQLQREFHFATGSSAVRDIRNQILSSLLSPPRISRNIPARSYSARFELDWNLLEFFQTQAYLNPPDQVLPKVITITGTSCDAQAMTCAEYLSQTWATTGNSIIQFLQEVLQSHQDHMQPCKRPYVSDTCQGSLPGGTMLTAWTSDSKLIVQVTGASASISETGEQLAWLGAALRTSSRKHGLSYCTPFINGIYRSGPAGQESGLEVSQDSGLEVSQDFGLELPGDIVCEIGFRMEPVPPPRQFSNGHCWHDMFRNPIIVKGYPILSRTEQNTGLDIPLNIMAGLARAQRVDYFKEKVYIKGFSTMLVPTKRDKGTVYWHLIYKQDGSRISYLDDRLHREGHIDSLDLMTVRHVLGWCSEARFYAGSAQAHYNVRHSDLPKVHSECALAGTIVSLGKIITGGSSFELGIKDTPVHVTRNGYIPQLKWISSKFVLLWDEQDKRGWLINGTSALLHIVRASLAYDSTDKFRSAFLFKDVDLNESSKPFTPDSAIDVLIHSKNLGLNLYAERNGHIVFKDRIDQVYNLLEKMLDHQTDITRHGHGRLAAQPRKYLEGWDFHDLAANRDPLYPRVATLETAGKSWVDLTRALKAVTLTGRGFGELLQPMGSDRYDPWATLPKQRYLIASCVSDLEGIIRDHRSCTDEHTRLSDDLIWHTPTAGRCRGGSFVRHDGEPVQMIFPSALSSRLLPTRCSVDLGGTGALVWGHNPHFPWIWGDSGHPYQGQLRDQEPMPPVEDVTERDNRMSRSFTSSGSESRAPSFTTTFSSMTSMSDSSATAPPWPEVRKYTHSQYTVGILCALPVELKAVRALFDEKHPSLPNFLGDDNQYALGQMARHMVVAASLPAGEYGTNSAASAVSDMMRSFFSLQFCLLVGIAGGAPSEENDIRLGDVVVSLPTRTFPGVIQYDLGKENEGSQFELTGVLQRPPRVLTNAISKLRSDPDLGFNPLDPHLTKIVSSLPTYGSPGQELDVLFQTTCSKRTCLGNCTHLQQRLPRLTTEPRIHYGLVASGNRVVKNAVLRDQLERDYGMLCFEMEAAGVMNRANCLVIRGICDYCDARKNKVWQNYAAATAAAYAKLLLGAVAVNDDISSRNERDSDGPMPKRRRVEADYVY